MLTAPRNLEVLFVSILSAVFVFGCSRPAVHLLNVGPATLPDGWLLAKSEKYDISVGYPSSWRFGPNLPTAAIGNLGPDSNAVDPEATAAKEQAEFERQMKDMQASWEAQGIVLLVSDGSRTLSGEVPNQFKLTRKTMPGNASLDDAKAVIQDELSTQHEPTLIDTPIGRAAELASDYNDRAGDSIHLMNVAFVDGHQIYVLKFSCTGETNIFKPYADQVIQSLRIRPGIVFPESQTR